MKKFGKAAETVDTYGTLVRITYKLKALSINVINLIYSILNIIFNSDFINLIFFLDRKA